MSNQDALRSAREVPEIVTHWPTVGIVVASTAACIAFQLSCLDWPPQTTATATKTPRADTAFQWSNAAGPPERMVSRTRVGVQTRSDAEPSPRLPELNTFFIVQRSIHAWTSELASPRVSLRIPISEHLLAVASGEAAIDESQADGAGARQREFPPWRRDLSTEYELRESLKVETVDLNEVEGTSEKLLKVASREDGQSVQGQSATKVDEELFPEGRTLASVVDSRDDLPGLPFLKGSQCRLDSGAAGSLQEVSAGIRRRTLSSPASAAGSLGSVLTSRDEIIELSPEQQKAYDDYRLVLCVESNKQWHSSRSIPGLVQMLQAEAIDVRKELVRVLERVNGERATKALAERAVFDLSPEIREAAIEALKQRPAGECREMFLKRLQYPWPPAADHAAEALVALDDRAAIPALIDLLDQPDPARPFRQEDGNWAVTEVVRLNHLRNCLLCHAVSRSPKDLVRGLVPTPGRPLPRVYYSDRSSGNFVRADITYLRQDFSISEYVANAKPWPDVQRFDYLLRTRVLNDDEFADARTASSATDAGSYPQRDSVLFALRKLTGIDAGHRTVDWREQLSVR